MTETDSIIVLYVSRHRLHATYQIISHYYLRFVVLSIRSLGVHISFVRSIAMDSWTPAQMTIMKLGGNQKCQSYLSSKGILPSTPIKAKYESDAAQLYKEILKARAEGTLKRLFGCVFVIHFEQIVAEIFW